MIKLVLSFLFGIGVATVAWEGYQTKHDYDAVAQQWRNVVRIDRLRCASIRSLMAALKRASYETETTQSVGTDLDDLTRRGEEEIVALPVKFEMYDRARKRLSSDLKEFTTSVRSDRAFVSKSDLIPVVSQIEGTESVAVRAEYDYEVAAEKYMRHANAPMRVAAHRLGLLPAEIGRFEAFAEAGPEMPDLETDDD